MADVRNRSPIAQIVEVLERLPEEEKLVMVGVALGLELQAQVDQMGQKKTED